MSTRFVVTPEFVVIETENLEAVIASLRKFIVTTLKATIEDADVIALLPFASAIACGDNHNHIINMSAYPVSTKYHTFTKHEALCGCWKPSSWVSWWKPASTREKTYYRGLGAEPTCPGCIAKAKGVIVNNLLQRFPPERLNRKARGAITIWFNAGVRGWAIHCEECLLPRATSHE